MKPDGVTLRQLRYLIALSETPHFRKAAERCGISQPSLTAQIQNLEAALELQLVERGRSGVAITPVGREVITRARKVLENMQEITDFAQGAQHGLTGTIRLGTKPTLGPYLLPHIATTLHHENPDLKLHVREGAPRDLEFELADGRHDVILAQLPVTGSELFTRRLFREPLYLALPADHALARQTALAGSDLSGLQVLTLSPQYHLNEQFAAICEECGATLLRDYEGTSLDALRTMVSMNMGVAFLPALYTESEITARSGVIIRQVRDRAIFRSIGLVWRKSAGRAGAYRKLAELIRTTATNRFGMLVPE